MMDLIGKLTSELGVSEAQATGGAGAIFKMAQEKLGGDFSQVSGALPGVMDLIGKAPAAPAAGGGGLGGIASAAMSAVGGGKMAGLASLAGAFKTLDLDAGMVTKFLPVVMGFAKTQGGDTVTNLLSSVLK